MNLKIVPLFLSAFFLSICSPVFAAKPAKIPPKPIEKVLIETKLITPTPGQAGRLNACLARETSVKNRTIHLVDLITKMETTFDSISMKVENYYIDNIKPTGKTVPNYDSLVSAISTQKAAIAVAITTAQTDADTFNCVNTPKSQVNKFREDMQSVKQALKTYRASINKLIVAVSTVVEEENEK